MDNSYQAARERIATQKGKLHGWRPLRIGDDVAVVALEVLGDVRGEPETIGMRVVVAGRTSDAIESRGEAATTVALRKRAVLDPDEPLVVERHGPLHEPESGARGDDPLTWPWRALTFHVPAARLPAIAGLASDAVRGD